MADVLTPLVVKTKTAGDIAAKIVDSAGTNLLAVDSSGRITVASIANALPTGGNVIGAVTQSGTWNVGTLTSITNAINLPMAGNADAQTAAANQAVALTGFNGTTWDRLQVDASKFLKVNVSAALPTGGNTIGNVGVVAGSAIIGKVGIDQTTPGTTNGVQITGPGTSSGNPLYVNTGSGGGTLQNSGQLSGSVSANGGTATLAATVVTSGKTGYLQQITVTASAPMKWDLQTVNAAGAATTVFSLFTTGAYLTFDWKPQNANQTATVASAGTNVKFQVVATNEDPANTVTGYATIWWSES